MEAAPVAVQKQVGETTITFDIAVPYYNSFGWKSSDSGNSDGLRLLLIINMLLLPKLIATCLSHSKYHRLGKIKSSDR